MKRVFINVGKVIIGILGSIIILYSVIRTIDNCIKSTRYIETSAVVSRYYGESSHIGRNLLFSYNVDGEEYKTIYGPYFSRRSPFNGMVFTIKYDPNDPSKIVWPHDMFQIHLFLYGIFFVVVATRKSKSKTQ